MLVLTRRLGEKIVINGDIQVKVLAVHGPPRMPAGDEVLKLPGSIVRIQAPAATLEWALYGRYQSAALARLEVPH